jgi:hypothetical protein
MLARRAVRLLLWKHLAIGKMPVIVVVIVVIIVVTAAIFRLDVRVRRPAVSAWCKAVPDGVRLVSTVGALQRNLGLTRVRLGRLGRLINLGWGLAFFRR